MRRRDVLVFLAGGAGVLAGCSTTPGAEDDSPSPTREPGSTPDGSDTPTSAEDTPPTGSPDTPATDTDTRGSPGSPEATETPVDPYDTFPAGPKEPPEKPDELTLASATEYVKTFEYRYVYNSLWFDESTEVHAECEIRDATSVESGFRVLVSCTAYSNTGGEPRENGTGTSTVMHADWFTQAFVYVVTEDSVTRRRAEG